MESKKETRQTVAKHNTHDDGWIIINKRVYNISKFISYHPGGETILLQFLGDDGTEGFEMMKHSSDAMNVLKKYFIGNLVE